MLTPDDQILDEQQARLAEELAAFLRSAHESAIRLRTEARVDAETEAQRLIAAATDTADGLLARAEGEAQELLRHAFSFSKGLRADAEQAVAADREAAAADRLEAADLLDSTRKSAAALIQRAEQRAQAIIEAAKTDPTAVVTAKALHPSAGDRATRLRLVGASGRVD